MNTRKLYREKYDSYTFRDLEYGVKLLREDIAKIDEAIKTLTYVVNSAKGTKRSRYYAKSNFDDVHILLEKRKTDILEVIDACENEMTDRLLTGNDDGLIERELLGANNV